MKLLEQLNLKDKKYIIFDLDGTLVDSIGVWNITDQKLIKKYGGVTIELDTIQRERDDFLNTTLEGDTYILYAQYLMNKYKFKDINIEELSIKRRLLAGEILETDVDFKPGVVELIYKLKNLGYTVILATMTTNEQLKVYYEKNQKMLNQLNIKETFDYIVTINDVGKKKPDPEIFNRIVKYYDAKKEEVLIFEDSYTGVLASKNAGIEVINIYDQYADVDRQKIDELTDYKIMDYQEIIELIDLLPTSQRKQKLEKK